MPDHVVVPAGPVAPCGPVVVGAVRAVFKVVALVALVVFPVVVGVAAELGIPPALERRVVPGRTEWRW